MSQPLPPFSCTHTPDVPELLCNLGCTLVLTTYQAGKVIFLSATPDSLIQLPRTFDNPMGVAVAIEPTDQPNQTAESSLHYRLAIGLREEVVVLASDPGLGYSYPRKPSHYDNFFLPRATYFVGELALHDMAWGRAGLWAVNTRFSCLALIDDTYSFRPQWQPPFITSLMPEDRCHLNGMALVDGQPLYVTALGSTDTPGGWRENKMQGGLLMHVPSGEIIAPNLAMPHSPRVFDDTLYLLNSATGEVLTADPQTGHLETVNCVPGFARGLSKMGDYAFIGVSRIRKKHIFGDLPIAKEKVFAGIIIIHLPTGALVGQIQYLTSCEEIYDVQVLPGLRQPGILNHTTPLYRHALSLPNDGFWSDPDRNT